MSKKSTNNKILEYQERNAAEWERRLHLDPYSTQNAPSRYETDSKIRVGSSGLGDEYSMMMNDNANYVDG